MLRRILVGLHGTAYSLAAMELAIELAARQGATIVGLGVVDVPRATASQAVPLGGGAFKERRDAAALQAEHQAIDTVLAAFAQHCQAASVACQTCKLEGDPAQHLVRQAQRCDLLVVGKRHVPTGEGEPATRTLDQLLHHAPRPTLCVPVARLDGAPVLVAYDGSEQAARTLQAFVHSGLAADRGLHVASLGPQGAENAQIADEFLRSHDLTGELHVEPAVTDPAPRILALGQELGAGLLVMGAYGRPRLKEFLFGSVTRMVLSKTTLPVFLFH